MPAASTGGDLLQRALDAQLRYYAELGQLAVEYVDSLSDLSKTLRFKLPGDDVRFGDGPSSRPWHVTATPRPAPAAAPPEPPTPAAIVLEAESGSTAAGVFLVENGSSQPVSSAIAASTFTAPDGAQITPGLRFEPEIVTLEPGRQLLVEMTAAIDDDLVEGVGYRGTLSVPGLPGTNLAIVVRRRAPAS